MHIELVREYSPSIIGQQSSKITSEMKNICKEVNTKRAMQRLLKERQLNTILKSVLHPGDKIWLFYSPSPKTELITWIKLAAIEAEDHFETCTQFQKQPAMETAYEYARLVLNSLLAKQLMSQSL